MPVQAPLQKPSVVGEDGELIQADMTVNPDTYAEYVATHVRRDPLWFRMREHMKDWGCVYLFFVPWVLFIIFSIVLDALSNSSDFITHVLAEINISLFILAISVIGVTYFIYKISRFFSSR